jgi:hypothetical protein
MHAECIDIAALKRAIETRDARTMAAFYADDALLRIIDCDNPPSKPRELAGKGAIVAYYDDVCSRAMTHSMESGAACRLGLPSQPDCWHLGCARGRRKRRQLDEGDRHCR